MHDRKGKCPNQELLLWRQGRRTAALFCAHGPLGGLVIPHPAPRLPRPEPPLRAPPKRPTQMTCLGATPTSRRLTPRHRGVSTHHLNQMRPGRGGNSECPALTKPAP